MAHPCVSLMNSFVVATIVTDSKSADELRHAGELAACQSGVSATLVGKASRLRSLCFLAIAKLALPLHETPARSLLD
jgi:hypothetical protein